MKYQHLLAPMVLPNGVVLKNRLLSSNALPHFLQGPETWLNDPILVYQAQVARNAAIVTMGDWTDPNQHTGMRYGDGCHFPSFNMDDPSVENSIALYCDVLHMQGSKALMSLMLQAPTGYDVCEDAGGGFVMPPMQPGDPNDEDTPPQPAMPFGPPMGEPGEEPDEAMKDMMQMMMGPKKAATREVMDQMIADAVKKVKRWQELGFDGISIHMAYTAPFCAKMLSPLTNHRTDEFGGPIENRSRFLLMLCGAIKEACGDKFLVEVLMSGKKAPGGITVEDTVAFAKLAEGKMDLMAAGRAFVCEPDYVKKLHEGRGEDIVPCIRCNKCHGLSMNGPWLTACSVNPKLGLDHVKDRIFPEPDRSKKVAIIGGSEIGCETGMYVAESGRDVTVFTRQNQLAPSAQRVHYGLPALGYHGLKQKLCCTTTAVEGGTLRYTNFKGQEKSLDFDSIIVSGGVHPRTAEALSYYGSAPEFYIAGDCAGDGEGSLQKALRSAYGIAMQI